jgi:hypothetical protein
MDENSAVLYMEKLDNIGGTQSTTTITGWCFGTMEFYDFPFSWEWNNHPNCYSLTAFFRGVG